MLVHALPSSKNAFATIFVYGNSTHPPDSVPIRPPLRTVYYLPIVHLCWLPYLYLCTIFAQIFVRIFNKHSLGLELFLYISDFQGTFIYPGIHSFVKVTGPTVSRTLVGMRVNKLSSILALMEFTLAGGRGRKARQAK